MNTNEIKKALYKEKPTAKIDYLHGEIVVRGGIVKYKALLQDGTEVGFDVKVSEMGDADLLLEMPAQLLIRYIAA